MNGRSCSVGGGGDGRVRGGDRVGVVGRVGVENRAGGGIESVGGVDGGGVGGAWCIRLWGIPPLFFPL